LKLGHDIVDYRLGETTQENDDNAGLDSELLEERKDMDFTDHLWKVWCCWFFSRTFILTWKSLVSGKVQVFLSHFCIQFILQFQNDHQNKFESVIDIETAILSQLHFQYIFNSYIRSIARESNCTRPGIGVDVSLWLSCCMQDH
jgi:hypothetical protein